MARIPEQAARTLVGANRADRSASIAIPAQVMPHFHPFRLDTVNECLWRRRDSGDEERLLLPPKAYGVLRHLIERAGRLVTQDELLDAVWPDTHIQREGLKSQILHIRRVLDDDPKRPRFIETLQRKRQIAFVTGESGIGKTALVDAFQFRADAERPGLRIARGQCIEGYGGKEPYYPMLE